MTTFSNLSSQPNIGPVGWNGSGTASAMNGESWAIQTNFSSSTKLVYGGAWLSNLATVDDDGGLEITISGSNFVISCNAGNDTGDPNELSVGTGSFGNTVTVSSGDTVNIKDSSGAIGYFTVPSFSTSTSSGSGGGTSTEGSSTPSGSTYINSQGQIVFVINASSPSSDGTVAYKIFRRPVGSTIEQAYVVSHTSGTITEFTIGINQSLYDRWELRVESSTGLVDSATLAVYITRRKVFCNFW